MRGVLLVLCVVWPLGGLCRARCQTSPARSTLRDMRDRATLDSDSGRIASTAHRRLKKLPIAGCPDKTARPSAARARAAQLAAQGATFFTMGRCSAATGCPVPTTAQEGPVKLYDSAMAPNPRRVRIFLPRRASRAGQQVDIGKADRSRVPAKNPMGGCRARARRRPLPLESVAICRYFEERAEAAADRRRCDRPRSSRCGSGAWRSRSSSASPAPSRTRTTSSRAASRRCRVRRGVRGQPTRLAWLDGELAAASSSPATATRSPTSPRSAASTSAASPSASIRLKNLQRWHEAVSSRPSAKASP